MSDKNEKKNIKKEKFLAKQMKEKVVKKEVIKKSENNENIPIDNTPIGDKKILIPELPKSYHPKYVESAWYSWWEKSGFFKPEIDNSKEKFIIPIPPPNVTGSLHLGHALTNSIQDALCRYHRMKGKTVLWNPGCDHAGIATQVVVEKEIMKELQKTRHDIGRDEFIDKVWEWKEVYGSRIYDQLRRLGSSVDWERSVFTMDSKFSKAVTEAFVQLYETNNIYRSTRLVNWCPKLKTTISNLEIDYMKLPGRTLLNIHGHNPNKKYEFGVLIHFAYKIDGCDDEIIVATTRIETMLGDTAIAVHPDDKRYNNLIGSKVIHPFVSRKLIIIGDKSVDPLFGSGAVKITPAHDPNDYEIGKRHKLEFINILNDDGTINENGGDYCGLMRFDCREKIINDLKEKGLYRDKTDNIMDIPICSRSGDIIEFLLKPQWYVKTDEMSKAAIECVKNKELEIIPNQFEKTWFNWLENPIDWCISRQLWWGHRIPVYFININDNKEDNWVVGRTYEEAMEKAIKIFPNDKFTLEQDNDVLDTWFSSGLFPFAMLGWPDKTLDLDLFYPNTLLETGHDILFFWVARMVMLGITLTGKVPFKQVYLHAMIRDAHGRKMSKSLGNVIDPIDIIEGISLEKLEESLDLNTNIDLKEKEKAKKIQRVDFPNGIAECGTDALRFALCSYTHQARDINLDIKRVEGYRHFCNKIWNAFRFSLMNLGDYEPTEINWISITEKWILSRLNYTINECDKGFQSFDFTAATSAIYNFWVYEFCDYYLELIKPIFRDTENLIAIKSTKNILYTCLDVGLKLLHPFMPFITEELYQRLPKNNSFESISIAQYPEINEKLNNLEAELQFKNIIDIVKGIRSLRSIYCKPKDIINVYILCKTTEIKNLILSEKLSITTLTKSELFIIDNDSIPSDSVLEKINDDCDIYIKKYI